MQAIYDSKHSHATVFRGESGRFLVLSRYGHVLTLDSERVAHLCADNTDKEIEANGNWRF